jgi:hypothetical protein
LGYGNLTKRGGKLYTCLDRKPNVRLILSGEVTNLEGSERKNERE